MVGSSLCHFLSCLWNYIVQILPKSFIDRSRLRGPINGLKCFLIGTYFFKNVIQWRETRMPAICRSSSILALPLKKIYHVFVICIYILTWDGSISYYIRLQVRRPLHLTTCSNSKQSIHLGRAQMKFNKSGLICLVGFFFFFSSKS